jgi:hypothetical protein
MTGRRDTTEHNQTRSSALASTQSPSDALTCKPSLGVLLAAALRENHDRRPANNACFTTFSQFRACAAIRPGLVSGAVCVGSNPTGGAGRSNFSNAVANKATFGVRPVTCGNADVTLSRPLFAPPNWRVQQALAAQRAACVQFYRPCAWRIDTHQALQAAASTDGGRRHYGPLRAVTQTVVTFCGSRTCGLVTTLSGFLHQHARSD